MILVTGGAGYIGSHTVVALIDAGYEVFVLDDFSNSVVQTLDHVFKMTGTSVEYCVGSINDSLLLRSIFEKYDIKSVIHFAGLKSVSDSLTSPMSYYDVNVKGTMCLLQEMERASVFDFIFSSSATVYGNPVELPISENHPLGEALNPYGQTKQIVELMLNDLVNSNTCWNVGILRYFNPIGAHSSGFLGENPRGQATNVMPLLMKAAYGESPYLSVFGDTHGTADGTGVRDYIHVMDLASGHISALNYIAKHGGLNTWNLGTGKGYSVLELIRSFESVTGIELKFQMSPKRRGDVAICFADPSKANLELNWMAQFDLDVMISDSWKAFLNFKA